MKLSRDFVSLLIGCAVTVLAWFGPWSWPAAPAFLVLNRFFGGNYADFPTPQRALVVALLITVNSFSWGVVAFALLSAVKKLTSKKAPKDESAAASSP
jgi:hypothetical protein